MLINISVCLVYGQQHHFAEKVIIMVKLIKAVLDF